MDQDQVDGVSGSSDVSVAAALPMTTDYEYARQLVQAYFAMLTTGCQRDECSNENCCSNPQTPALSASEAAIKSIYFATQAPAPLCIDLAEQPPPEIPEQQQEQELTPEQPQAEEENQTEDTLPLKDEQHQSKEELHPETSEADIPKPQQPETTTPQSTSERKSTPRQRLSIAVQLDHGLNKNPPVTSVPNDVTATKAATEDTEQQQEHEQAPVKVPSSVKDARQRRLSRPKEKLFDAIKRSFSRSKKGSV
uniref:Ubiquitin-protein ligase E3A N-terminal zinc-binding domain-containing protein n=1 Tax=Phytophthora ramorum TaxID=164328 RepID=H3GZA5_PHYRM